MGGVMIRALTWVIGRVSGRAVHIDPLVSGSALVKFTGATVLGCLRGLLRQLCAFRRPRLLIMAQGSGIVGLRVLRYGARLRLGRGTRITCWSRQGIAFGDDVSFGEYCTVMNGFNPFSAIGSISLGSNVGIGAYSYICCPSLVEIGSDTIVGQYLSIHPQDHVFDASDRPIRLQGVRARGVKIGADCWIGAKVTILDGVTLGDGCVVAAGAVVNRSFDSGSIIGGVPARLLASRQ